MGFKNATKTAVLSNKRRGKPRANHCDAMLSLNGRTSRLKLENYEVK